MYNVPYTRTLQYCLLLWVRALMTPMVLTTIVMAVLNRFLVVLLLCTYKYKTFNNNFFNLHWIHQFTVL
jgi:hypothetical protein